MHPDIWGARDFILHLPTTTVVFTTENSQVVCKCMQHLKSHALRVRLVNFLSPGVCKGPFGYGTSKLWSEIEQGSFVGIAKKNCRQKLPMFRYKADTNACVMSNLVRATFNVGSLLIVSMVVP